MRRVSLRLIFTAIGFSLCFILIAFVTSNYSRNTNEKPFQSIKCDDPSAQEAGAKISSSISNITSKSTRSKPCIEVKKSSPVQRAIVIYYPHHQSEYFFPEVRWYV